LSTPDINAPPNGHPADEPVTTESLGWQLRAALPPLRLHSLSLYDLEGEVLWLSEGALGPDEHGLVVEALGSLGEDPSSAYREDVLEDGRAAVLLAARSRQSGLTGLVMILLDSKSLSSSGLAARVLTPPVQAILERLAVLMAGEPKRSPADTGARAAAGAPPTLALEPTTVDELLTLEVAKGAPHAKESGAGEGTGVWRALPAGAASGQWAAPSTAPGATGQWAAPSPKAGATGRWSVPPGGASPAGPRPAAAPNAAVTAEWRALPGTAASGQWPSPPGPGSATGRWIPPLPNAGSTGQWNPLSANGAAKFAVAAPRPASGEVRVQELARLRSGDGTRRYLVLSGPSIEASGNTHVNGILLDTAAPEAAAVRTIATRLRELTEWLVAHRQTLEHVPLSFSIAIDAAALAAEELPDAIAECVQPAHIRPGTVGFEIAEALCLRYRSHAARLFRKFETLGCALVLDDFVLDSSALELLRSKTLRLLKVHAGLIAGVSRDRLCQARAVAIAQAAKVLGIHCSAKGVEDQATCRWLAWAGFELAEGPLFERPLSLTSLSALLAEAN
jgi:EAL domain-containing protein (putative c-di-GMP-specific phosphodiesterase class I)